MTLHDATSAKATHRTALKGAMKEGNRDAVLALRSALAAIDNAESVKVDGPPTSTTGEYVAVASLGAGSSEAERRRLSPEELLSILKKETSERLDAAAKYESLGRTDDARRLRREAAALTGFLEI